MYVELGFELCCIVHYHNVETTRCRNTPDKCIARIYVYTLFMTVEIRIARCIKRHLLH